MKKYDALKIAASVLVAAGLLAALPGKAEASWFRGRHDRRSYSYHETIVVLPRGSARLIVAGNPYYYCRGSYYKPHERGYVRVPAPIGAVVSSLPQQEETIVIDGVVYHRYDGVYYKGGPAGYTVVPVYPTGAVGAQNVAIAQQPVAVAQPAPAAAPASPSTLIVNVPNKNGSFTPVTLQLAANGMYIGPQGEVYTSFPTSEQLKSMYGR